MFSNQKNSRLCWVFAVAIIAMVSGNTAFSQDKLENSLRDAVLTGFATHPELALAVEQRFAADEVLIQRKAAFHPTIDLNGDIGIEYNDTPSTRALASDGLTETKNRRQIGVTLSQILFDGGASRSRVKQEQARVLSSARRVRETSEQLGLSIIEAYLNVLRARQHVDLAEHNVNAHADFLRQIQEGIDGGRLTQADGFQAEARLAEARAIASSIHQDLTRAEAEYKQQVGVLPPEHLIIPDLPVGKLAPDVAEITAKALEHNPTLDVRKADIDVSVAEKEGAKSLFYPKVDFQLNARTGDDLGGIEGRDTSAAALVVMKWNLYRGGADLARERELLYRYQGDKDALVKAERQIENTVHQVWASFVAADEQIQDYSNQVQANKQVVVAYKDQFTLDRRSLLDVLDTQTSLFSSHRSLVDAQFTRMRVVYRLLALQGELLPVLGLNYPKESVVSTVKNDKGGLRWFSLKSIFITKESEGLLEDSPV